MNTKDKLKGQNLFLEAIEQDNPISHIQKACIDNKELEKYALDLLVSHKTSNDYFIDLENSITSSHLNEIEDHLFRDIDLGKYQIIKILKQGGMGTVFLAKRSDGEFKREVVIKMIPIDLNFSQSHNQFAHEKEILASLVHPNIVQLYDSGITNKGQSYFVMELIKGKTLIKHCNQEKLSIKQRLTLFCEVLHAVGFAHQHLIVHGDIKPSNIMVNEENQVKLLDFGIAELLYKTDTTAKGGSLNYFTPEHSESQKILTSSDIHQLGQLLLELLTNISPYKLRDKDFNFSNLATIAKHLTQKEFIQQSTNTSSNKKKLLKFYHSDLKFIIAKSLAKNPQQRYRSAQEFESDLNNFLNKFCVNARQITAYYQLSQYLKRNIYLSFFVISLVVFLASFTLTTKRHNDSLALERDNALKVKNLIIDVFSAADPSLVPGKDLTANEVLDVGLRRLKENFNQDSDTQADLLQVIAQTYQNLGKYEKAQLIFNDVFKIRNSLHPNNEIIKAQSLLMLGENARLMSQNKQAKIWLTQSLQILTKAGNQETSIVKAKSKLGRVLVLLGELNKAESLLKESTQLTLTISGKNSIEYAQALNDLNSVYFRQGKYQIVESLLIESKNIREEILSDSTTEILDIDYATNINNLGLANYLQGKFTEGEGYFRKALALRNKIYLNPHPDHAQSLTNLGLLLNDDGRAVEALPYILEALKIRQITLTKGHSKIDDAWNNLAMVYHENQKYIQAIEIYKNLVNKTIELKGHNYPQLSSMYTNMANTYLALNEFEKAFDYFSRSLKSRQQTLPENHLYLSYSYIGLGRSEVALGNIIDGKKHILKGLLIREEKLPEGHWLLGEAYYANAMVKYIEDNADEELTKKACHILSTKKGKDHPLSQNCQTLLKNITGKKL